MLVESEKLDAPIFSPATKAETGHDENITVARVREILGNDVAEKLESMARTVYNFGERIARHQGIIIADAEFKFGRAADGRIILIDEVMTPDSSPFLWPPTSTSPAGRSPRSTNSRCATISTPSAAPAAGMATLRPRNCRTASWMRRASGISKRIGG